MHNKLPHLIYFALIATNYFDVFMSTTVLLGLTSFEKIGGQWIFGGASDFSNLLAPWASGSRSLMLRAVTDTTIDNIYRKAIPGFDNSHREECLSSIGGTSIFLQLCPLVVFSSTSTGRVETLYSPCVYLYTSIMSPIFRRHESEGRDSFYNHHSSS